MTDKHPSVDRTFQAAGLLAGVSLMFVPLWLVYRFQMEHPLPGGARGAEAAVGVAVILRTTFRRLLRAGTSNLLRTSVGAFSRTSARTMTRRLARTSARLVLGLFALRPQDVESGAAPVGENKAAPAADGAGSPPDAGPAREWAVSLIATLIGFVALALSFGLVASRAIDSGTSDAAAAASAGGISLLELSLMAALPLVIYAAAAFVVARGLGASTRVRTAIDGLLLQGYFAGAGSFLPMTTDIEYTADARTQSRIAFRVLLILYALHLVLLGAAWGADSQRGLLLSSLTLVYCFVYSFPIRPLEGFWIWNTSKLAWALLWIPILTSFLVSMPAAILSLL